MGIFLNKRFKLASVMVLLPSFAFLNKEPSHKLTQTVPPDMVYVPGNGSIQPFYISVTEEPNLNWRIYTEWVRTIYVDYPEVYKQSLPLKDMQLTASRYNDPVIDNYANHPAYNYYPVVGVTWMQIQDYLHWKTDRLNEVILIKNDFTKIDRAQVNEENFVTESFLEGQKDLKTGDPEKHKLLKRDGYGDGGFNPHPFIMNNGIFIPHYRLPTEAEWDLANAQNKQEVKSGKSLIYGNEYFLNIWNEYDHKSNTPKYTPFTNTNNMGSGVQEWLIDQEGFEHESGYTSFDIYYENGYNETKNAKVFDIDSIVEVKDSLGMFDFIFIDYDNFNKPVYIIKACRPFYEIKRGEIDNPFYNNHELYKKYKWNYYSDGKYGWYISPCDSVKYLTHKTWKVENIKVTPYVYQKRKVKSGNWKYNNDKAILMNENEASELTGFRCVLPATSVAVDPKYKVKWD